MGAAGGAGISASAPLLHALSLSSRGSPTLLSISRRAALPPFARRAFPRSPPPRGEIDLSPFVPDSPCSSCLGLLVGSVLAPWCMHFRSSVRCCCVYLVVVAHGDLRNPARFLVSEFLMMVTDRSVGIRVYSDCFLIVIFLVQFFWFVSIS